MQMMGLKGTLHSNNIAICDIDTLDGPRAIGPFVLKSTSSSKRQGGNKYFLILAVGRATHYLSAILQPVYHPHKGLN